MAYAVARAVDFIDPIHINPTKPDYSTLKLTHRTCRYAWYWKVKVTQQVGLKVTSQVYLSSYKTKIYEK